MAGARRETPTGSGPTVRPARRADAESIASIYNEAVRSTTATFDTEPRSLARQLQLMEDHDANHPLLVAELEGEVAGWASLSPWSERCAYDGTAEVSVYVGERWRNRGIGRALVTEILAAGPRCGLHTILARIAEGNPASRRLHQSLGFDTVGVMREVGYKFGRFLDVELMQLTFPQGPSHR